MVKGHSLCKIAKKQGLTLARLLKLNPQKIPNPNVLAIGKKIRIA